ncbi:glycosyltransferase family 39 protein [Patescibacteria group bacterium]|nr:glycosyltransferase family 39 protein [Patescibacteria group bacterium]MBU1473188.1 glycosyltransferase family 39 protein [Patescibacteria group bacterium]MBU2459762.1 glycosyltransferase family 39 protein [Patescibacteria group bacterium]MBU2544274.1 glycosyltransferase family 39 protein [Patescibacteria group bacterium]
MKKQRGLLFAIAVLFITLLTISVRLYKVTAPLADWHSWRQSDTAAVARNFLKYGFDPLRPRYDDLSNIQSGHDNPHGYRMVEFPMYQLVGAGLMKLFGYFPIEVWLRLTTIAVSAGTGILLTLLTAGYAGWLIGWLTGLTYAILPYGVYYGRVILPEPMAVFWAILSIYLISLICSIGQIGKEKTNWALVVVSGLAGAIALLTKPTAVFLLLPVLYFLYRQYGLSKRLFIGLLIYGLICVLPLILWRKWILQFPEGVPAYGWLLNDGGIRFKGAWWWWLFAKRFGELILGYWGLIPLGLGILVKPTKKEGWVFRWLLIGTLVYLVVFAAGNVRHDYYQILVLPIISIYVGKGFYFLLTNRVFSKAISYQLSAVSLLFVLAFSWYTIRTYYWINRPEIVEVGRIADQMLPKDGKVIAPYNGDTTFLYQINRQGWPLGFDIDKKITQGAGYYVTVSPTDSDWETRDLAKEYTVLVRNDKYAIIDLTRRK